MNGLAKLCFYITIATFLGFFVIEAILWMNPLVYGLLLPQLNPGLETEPATQAEILKALFVNQGLYNLMAAAGGIAALLFLKREKTETGIAFLVFTCVFGIVAALTLLSTTHAYALGLAQLVFPSVTLASLAVQFGATARLG